jgi:hypothetical protein
MIGREHEKLVERRSPEIELQKSLSTISMGTKSISKPRLLGKFYTI